MFFAASSLLSTYLLFISLPQLIPSIVKGSKKSKVGESSPTVDAPTKPTSIKDIKYVMTVVDVVECQARSIIGPWPKKKIRVEALVGPKVRATVATKPHSSEETEEDIRLSWKALRPSISYEVAILSAAEANMWRVLVISQREHLGPHR
ncbi:hypothetical protein Nepgr_012561 [Nepenthes gracilis]|uniref:Uncharacterized protein n=1 Tax=Nepenthes gracilis TaxID=150966 RepID=A0AAD3SH55_NEPGR|nr:hypothetical protein Nepgr_012561 [Nepenthes gracilis]